MTVTRVKTTAGWLDLNTTGPKGDKGDPGYYEYSYIAIAGATKDLSTPVGTWSNFAIPTTVNINQPAGAFTVNANGSLTVRDAGIYDIEASVAAAGAWTTANIRMMTGLGIGATAIAAGDVIARADSTVSVVSGYPSTTLAGSYYLTAGSIVWVTYFGVANAGTASCAHFSIVRMGAGPPGPTGVAGAPGPATLETYIGPNAPSPRGDYTVWIDTDEPQASWLPPTRVTSLPASPFDGQEVYLVADAGPPVVLWHMRRNAALAKWEFMGGPSITYRQEGENNNYINNLTTSWPITVDAAQTKLLRWVFTPPMDVWAKVSFHVGLIGKLDANYHYWQNTLVCTPVAAVGTGPVAYKTQHLQVMQYEPCYLHQIFGLTGGTTYTFTTTMGTSGGSWQYHQGQAQLHMTGEAWPR